jgi:putative NADH-flavin reductase
MKITVIGASAGIGLITVQKALERGHEVRALSRDTSAIPDHPLLTRINGSATAVDDVKKAIADTQLVIVTIGTKNKKPNTLFSDSAETLVSAADFSSYGLWGWRKQPLP